MTFLGETLFLLGHHLRTTLRMPVWVVIAIVQPVLWLVVFGQLFRVLSTLAAFDNVSYQQFLAPGLVIMSALMGSSYAGMGILNDVQSGLMDRFLATPVRRSAILLARVLQSAVTVVIQGVVILLVALLFGIGVPGGISGVLVVLAAAAILGGAASAASNGLALVIRQAQVLVATVNFLLLPMVFLSSMMMSEELMPGWIRKIAHLNPLDWGVVVARRGFEGAPWSAIAVHGGLLVLLVGVSWVFSLRAFDRYRATL